MKPTMQEREEAFELMQMLFSYDFKDAVTYNPDQGLYRWRATHEQFLKENGLRVACGASKACIISSNPNWVIKVGFQRNTMKYFHADTDVADYCVVEEEMYRKAVEAGCADHLAATYLGGEIDGIKFFLQERAKENEDMFEEMMYEYFSDSYSSCYYSPSERYARIDGDMSDPDSESCIYAVLGYSDSSDALVNFCYLNRINDLHPLNWGIAQDNRIVLIDFSGY